MNSQLVQPRLTKSREFSGRPTRGNSRIEGTRPVRSGLPPPPSRLPNLDREETRVGFPSLVSGAFAGVGRTTRRPGRARKEPHYRSRSRLSISGGSVCADGFLVGVPFTLQWPPMAVCEALDGQSRGSPDLRIDDVAVEFEDETRQTLFRETQAKRGAAVWSSPNS